MPSIIPFSFENHSQIRAVLIDNQPWFVAADICAVLDLRNPRSSIALLDDDEKDVHSMDTPGGVQSVTIINESGLYALILRSRKPEAKRFRKWVTSEVLPSIRKSGAYIHAPAMRPAITPEQVRELRGDVACFTSGWIKLEEQWVYNHMRVAFQVAKVEHIPQEFFPLAKQLIASKREAHREFVHFICGLCRWFEREVLGAGTPWTPAIQQKLTKKLKRQVILPPKVDWLALADESKAEVKA